MSQTILAPFDGSFEAARALPYAAVLAGHGGRVALLGVVPDDHAAAGAAQALHQAAARLRDGPCATSPSTSASPVATRHRPSSPRPRRWVPAPSCCPRTAKGAPPVGCTAAPPPGCCATRW